MFRCLMVLFMLMPLVAQAKDCSASSKEKFDKFFQRFTRDGDFAKQRTRYPLPVMMYARGPQSLEGVRSTVSEKEDEASLSLGELMQSSGLVFHGLKLTPKQGVVTLYRAQPAWRLIYRFTPQDGCWYLTELEDRAED